MSDSRSIDELPNELIHEIVNLLPEADKGRFGSTNHRHYELGFVDPDNTLPRKSRCQCRVVRHVTRVNTRGSDCRNSSVNYKALPCWVFQFFYAQRQTAYQRSRKSLCEDLFQIQRKEKNDSQVERPLRPG